MHAMKKTICYLFVVSALFTSCKENTKQNEVLPQQDDVTSEKSYSVNPSTTEVAWTAYKTTAKTPVKGQFLKLNLLNEVVSESKQGVLSGLEFTIPISSFFSNNEERDYKIKTLFFGFMDNTELLTGSFSDLKGDNSNGTITLNLKMNNVSYPVIMDYAIDGNRMNLSGVMQMMDWKINKAYESIHKACELLHTGEDGISKTWKEVALSSTVIINEN